MNLNLVSKMRFTIESLGCKVNIYEAEAVAYLLKQRGYIQVIDNPDVQIINTCTVTQTSDSKSRKLIRSKIKENPNAITVVMGCYSQLSSEEAFNIPGVNIVIGTNNRSHIYELIEEYRLFRKNVNLVSNALEYKTFENLCLNELSIHTRGFVKIQDGCENFCTYCAIPYARGPIKSRDPESVITEINALVTHGVKEVILAGINTGTYGKDINNLNLAKLIEKIVLETKIKRLRLSSIELMEITDELLDTIEKYQDVVCNHLHIPLQSACDETLKRVNRKYNMTEYISRIEDIRKRFPDIAITMDCLAGFVGETIEEFETTCENIKNINFAFGHIFPYSIRPNTVASKLKGHLDPKVIKERAKILINIQKENTRNYLNKFIGQEVEVLFEQKKNNYWYGHTTNYLEVFIEDQGIDLTNEIKKIKLLKVENESILGKEI